MCGGGIHGAWAALDAAQRGLKVALIDRGDFAGATSGNHQRIIHGGFRYLQHADFRRLRESVRERSTLLRIAPELVRPLPVLVPTLRVLTQRRAALRAAMFTSDLMSIDRNRGLPPAQRIPRGTLLSRREAALLTDGFNFGAGACTGAAMFYDAQVLSPERLVLSIVAAAARDGAVVANYIEATDHLREGTRTSGVVARDVLSGHGLEIRARLTVNCVGPWTGERVRALSSAGDRRFGLVKAAVLVVRNLGLRAALAVPCHGHSDRAELIDRGYRNLFLSPWRGLTLVGTFYAPHHDGPDRCTVSERDVDTWIGALTTACPDLELSCDDVLNVYCGLLPRAPAGASSLELSKRSTIIDHAHEHGVEGVLSVSGVKFTTARSVAERAIDIACRKLNRRTSTSRTARTRLRMLGPALIENAYAGREVLEDPSAMRDAVARAVREEMACTLADVVLARTDLAIAGMPPPHLLHTCARHMAELLGWDQRRTTRELRQLRERFPLCCAETGSTSDDQHTHPAHAGPVRTP